MPMTPEAMKQLFMEFEDALLHPEKLPALLADDFVAHDLPPGMSLPQFRAIANAAMPDGKFTEGWTDFARKGGNLL